mgnify:CR=1 FL=1
MENEEKKSSVTIWWQTFPGILTAIAALITATGGLMLTLNQVGCFDKTNSKNEKVIDQKENSSDKKLQNTYPETGKTEDSSVIKYTATVSKIDDVNFEGSVYKFLEAKLEYYSHEESLLKFNLNVANNINGVYVNADLFRLIVGRNKSAPESITAQWVEAYSSIDAEVVFIIPNNITGIQLQIGDVNAGEKGKIKIPINLNSK